MAKKNNARLLRVQDSPKLAELRATLQHYEKEAADVAPLLAEAEAKLQAAEDATLLAERQVLSGRATDSDLAVEQNRLMEAKRAYAIMATRAEDAQKMLKLLPAAIAEATADARAEVAATLRAQYQPAVERLKAALLAANEASQDVARIYDQAYREVTAYGLHPRYHSGAIDLGTAGLTTTAAGLVPLEWSEFQPDGHNRTRFAIWLEEADRMLARLPHMAEEDLASRESAEHSLVVHTQLEREKLARQAEIERKNAERFAGLLVKGV